MFAAVEQFGNSGSSALLLGARPAEPLRFPLEPADARKPIRFAVGRPGRRSSVWRLWANRGKDDVYVATRRSAGIFKVSLHETGDWRLQWVSHNRGDVAFTSSDSDEPSGRIMHRWSRPAADGSGWTDALSVWVPAEDVAEIPGDAEPGHESRWLDPAAPGGATEFRLFLVRPGRGLFNLTAALEGPDASLAWVNGFRLVGGETVLLFAATKRLNDQLRRDLTRVRRERQAQVAPGFDLAPESGPRAAFITVDDDGHRNIWDLSIAAT